MSADKLLPSDVQLLHLCDDILSNVVHYWNSVITVSEFELIVTRLKEVLNERAALSAHSVPDEVMRAVERMCKPLHESRVSDVTAQEDARCMKVIEDFILALASSQSS